MNPNFRGKLFYRYPDLVLRVADEKPDSSSLRASE